MKILLLNPPFKGGKFSRTSRSPAITKSGTLYYPFWLAYTTGVLDREGFETRLLDCPARGLSGKEALKIIVEFGPDLVVIDTSTPSIYSDVETGALIKENLKLAFIILVGTHPSSLPEETLLLSKSIDAVARGEYDYTIKDLAGVLASGNKPESVAGISFRRGDDIVHNEPRPLIEDLDKLPFVSSVYKKHLDIKDYFFAASYYPFIMMITGRGCPSRCTFCNYPQVFHSRRYRMRSPENVVEEFEYIKTDLSQVEEVGIEDDTFAADRAHALRISELLIKKNLNMPWYAASRADLDFETMWAMKSAGCRSLMVGFESGSQKILDNIHKGITIDTMLRFSSDAKRAGLLVHGCFMIGNPGETPVTVQETLEFAERLNCDTAQFFPLMVYPGTEAYEWAKSAGYIASGDFSEWVTKEGLHKSVVSTPELSAEELLKFSDYARRRFYLRPGYVWQKIKKCLKDPKELTSTLKSFKVFYKHLFK